MNQIIDLTTAAIAIIAVLIYTPGGEFLNSSRDRYDQQPRRRS
jgi:hypothetical protein